MSKFKIIIQKSIPDYPEISIEYEEKSKEKAIAKAHELLEDVAKQFSKGIYTGKLYKKNLLFGWCHVLVSGMTYTMK